MMVVRLFEAISSALVVLIYSNVRFFYPRAERLSVRYRAFTIAAAVISLSLLAYGNW